jgi:hypothetical protein
MSWMGKLPFAAATGWTPSIRGWTPQVLASVALPARVTAMTRPLLLQAIADKVSALIASEEDPATAARLFLEILARSPIGDPIAWPEERNRDLSGGKAEAVSSDRNPMLPAIRDNPAFAALLDAWGILADLTAPPTSEALAAIKERDETLIEWLDALEAPPPSLPRL